MTFASTILTLYPEMFPGPLGTLLAGKALERGDWSCEIGKGLASLDTDGHYSRPDVFELNVDTRAKDGVKW